MATKPTQYAHLSIGYSDYVLPADKAMKVAELMSHALKCACGYSPNLTYTLLDAPEVSFTLVRANQIRASQAEAEPAAKQTTIPGLPVPVRRLPR